MRVKDTVELQNLALRIQARDERALTDFYRLTKPALMLYIQRIVHDSRIAEEVLQDTLCYIWLNAATYEAERSAVPAWVYLIARSRAVDALRRDRRSGLSQTLQDDVGHGSMGDPEVEQMTRSRQMELRRYVHGLDAAHRKLIQLAFFEGYSHTEIADATNLPLGTVKSRIRVALATLRARLMDDERVPTIRSAAIRRVEFGTPYTKDAA